MSCYLFLLPTLILWAVIPNVVLKYVLVEVKELREQEANTGIIYLTLKMFGNHKKNFQKINIFDNYGIFVERASYNHCKKQR